MKKFFKIIVIILLLLVLGFAGLILTAIILDYDPEETTLVSETAEVFKLPDTLEFDILNWNIGYCGLGQEMDFFYDGGVNVRTTRESTITNLKGVLDFLKRHDSIEFFLLQEVDIESKRSYRMNQFDSISAIFSQYHAFFGKNYDVFFVPTPPAEPYGKVHSGLMSLSKYKPEMVIRYSFPGKYAFPKGLFMLDRCFLVKRYPVENGKELILINTHNEAYDDGSHRKAQMEYLRNFLMLEYQKGNYLVVGGDWNQCPPEIQTSIEGYIFDDKDFSPINKEYLPDEWKWIFKNDIPTNRRVMRSWDKTATPVTVIDFFLISPNVENISIQNIDLGFKHSDHHPVLAKFRLAGS
jgi:endonuclease/exonuclease/phosphatase family metal-dependent hydrolase